MQVLHLDPSTGKFTWKSKPARNIVVGSEAGNIRPYDGYIVIKYQSTPYYAHRLAFAFANGRWPEADIDHINGDRQDNRPSNLRECINGLSNNQNRKETDCSGVFFDSRRGTYNARIYHNGKLVHLGCYKSSEEARDAYVEYKSAHHPGYGGRQ